jgi:hypothetical protein
MVVFMVWFPVLMVTAAIVLDPATTILFQRGPLDRLDDSIADTLVSNWLAAAAATAADTKVSAIPWSNVF